MIEALIKPVIIMPAWWYAAVSVYFIVKGWKLLCALIERLSGRRDPEATCASCGATRGRHYFKCPEIGEATGQV